MPDGGADGGIDGSTQDAGSDVTSDSYTADVSNDASEAGVTSPALWSKGFASTTFRGLHPDTLLLADYTAGANVGSGALTGNGCIGVVVNDADGTLVSGAPVVNQPKCSCWDGVHGNVSPNYSVVVATCSGVSSTYIHCLEGPATNSLIECNQGNTVAVTTGTRAHLPSENYSGINSPPVELFDSLSSTIGCGLGPDQLGGWAGGQCIGTLNNTNAAAIDAADGPDLVDDFVVYGRQDGTSYDFSMMGVSTPSSGGGLFVAGYKNSGALQWVSQLGGTPLKPASDNTVGPDEGVGHSRGSCTTFAYTGTVKIGASSFTATSASHSVLLTDAVFKPPIGSGYHTASFDKGPAAAGKTSTPHCATGTAFWLVDTIWDWIDIGGTKIYAVHSNGDVVVAKISSTGSLLWSAVYGGPGTVRGSGVIATSKAIIIGGQSDAGIDLGQGLLSAGAFIAGLPP